ncbi:UHRF1-binding protein 1-like isoform X4 [Rhagoletis pomonella]|uniref:UHRF1-binding protein 1-like isoform X4 n=1 Tax=Rhagoletis pomonella TaxID=28610 RepID=UPI001783F463|nr:UHRF1-binding protein 1-like isoform X4 [Rhagoletis pomonella]
MVSLIKNQLLKHLSIYTKNLSSDKINLSTFRGEGDLKNLQLDEAVLTELLELPSWLRLTSAWCNHVSFRISWTKLKSVPITLTLDEVNISVETCDPSTRNQDANSPGGGVGSGGGRAGSGGATAPTPLPQVPQGKYSFIHKVVDGITIIVNTVNVKFSSAAFTASVQMSRIRVESKTPKWANADLRFTRLKDPQKGIILIFKELSWQTVRIEASSTQDKSLTPLRLLTNQARCRITLRKRLSDCTLLASRLVLILDDLLWVLTDSQLKAALHFVDSLSGLIKAATHATQKKNAARKLQTLPEYQALIAQQQNRQSDTAHTTTAQKMFNAFDVRETSYHFFSQRIDLHLCDDEGDGRSSFPELDKGGALQISVQAFQVDYYPYHLAKSDRAHWAKYREASVSPALWLKESLNTFREAVLNLSQPNRPSTHAPLERTAPPSPIALNVNALQAQSLAHAAAVTAGGTPPAVTSGTTTPNRHGSSGGGSGNASALSSQVTQAQQQKATLDNLAKLMSACVVLRIEDFTLYRVTTSGRKQMPKEFVSAQNKRKTRSGDKERYSFPSDMSIVHAEFTYFYYPGDFIFPLPPSKVFVHINPLQVHFDLSSVLWLNSFALNLHESLLRTSVGTASGASSTARGSISSSGSQRGAQSVQGSQGSRNSQSAISQVQQQEEPNLMYMDVKIEAIMPRVVIESTVDVPNQKDRPRIMQIQISRFAITNIREMGSSRADLAQALHSLQEGSLVFGTEFPSMSGDMCIVTDRILSHVAAADVGVPAVAGTSTAAAAAAATTTSMAATQFSLQQQAQSQLPAQLSKSASTQNLTRYAMWSEPRDVWCIKLDPVWVDFLGARSLGANKSIPFVDAVPVTLWLHSGVGAMSKSAAAASIVNNSNTSSVKGFSVETNINCMDYADGRNLPRNPFLSEEDVRIGMDWKQQRSFNGAGESGDGAIGGGRAKETGAKAANTERTADMHAIAHISNLVSVQIDHYQYLFLLRLAEEMTEMAMFLSMDAERILQKQNTKKSMIFGCVIPQIEVTLVMPSPTPGTNTIWPTPPLEEVKRNIYGSVETPSPVTNEPLFDGGMHISNPNTHGYNVQIQSTPTVASSTPSQGSRPDTGVYSQSITASTKSVRSTRTSTTGDATSITKEINSSLMSMKKGFSSFMTSIDSAIKSGAPSDDTSDTFSIQSDISSDSENFAIVMGDDKTMDCIDVMFRLNPFTNDTNLKVSPVEVASEVLEEPSYNKTNLSSPSEPSEASTWRRRDLVSMATFRLTTVELIRQNEGNSSSLRVQVAAVSCDECGAIPWDELQKAQQANKTKFGARCKAWNLAPYNPELPPCIRLRLEETLNPPQGDVNITDKKIIQSWIQHHAEVRVKDVNLDLSMSTVIGLGDLAEDEIITTPLPVTVHVENVRINLIEDRPPVNITSPGPVPIRLAIGRMRIHRDKNGIVNVQPIETGLNDAASSNYPLTAATPTPRDRDRDREILAMQLVMQQLKMDNDNLRKQLVNAKENADCYRQKTKQDNDVLRSYLKAAQDDITILLEEKKALLDTIRSLQEDDEKMDIMRKAFQMFDTQKSGFIETLRLKTILNSMGQMFEESELQELVDENDPEDTGKVNFDGFCNIAAHFLEEEDAEAIQKELKEAFRLYDREGNGYITTSTLKEILAALDDKLSSSDLDGIIAEIDTDGSGTVDFDEFMEMMTGD